MTVPKCIYTDGHKNILRTTEAQIVQNWLKNNEPRPKIFTANTGSYFYKKACTIVSYSLRVSQDVENR